MKKCTFFAVILLCIISAYSQIPQTISWQGILQDVDAKNLSGTYSLTVKLFDVASGGTALWSETHSDVVIADGLVNLTLGSVTPFSVNFDDEYWLEITVGNGTPLSRIKLSSVPYSMHSKTAESVNETDPTWSGNANTTGTISRTGKVGIGTNNPQHQLHLNSSGIFAGLLMTTDSSGTTMSDGFIIGMQYQPDEPTNRYATILNKENSALILGTNNNYQGDITILPGGNVGLGIDSPTARLDVNGQVRIRGGSPGAGKVLTSSVDGSATWENSTLKLPYSGTGTSGGALISVTNDNYLGTGVYGYGAFGVNGEAHETGIGVIGFGGWGVEGVSKSADGIGVYGRVQVSGTAIKGKVDNANDFSGYFIGGKFYTSSQVGIGTTSPSALLHVHGTSYSGGNVVFTGEYLDSHISQAPVEGSGTRMMWYPNKASFRAGRVTGTQWNKSNMGDYSTAFGYDTKASGYGSIALGYSSTASNTSASAIGFNTTASGNVSTALGYSSTASGYASTALGYYTTAKSGYETVVGSWNTDYTPATVAGWNVNDRLFVIGNGSTSASRSNAVTVLKNGYVGIGSDSPGAGLHLKGSGFPSSFMYLEANTGQDAGLRIYEGSTDKWHIFNNSNQAGLQIYNTGGETAIFAKQSNAFVGLGTTAPTQRIDVNGNARFRSIGSGAYSGVVNRTSDGTLTTATSDIRLKDNILTLQNSLERVKQLRGVSFTWKSNPEYGTRIGFVAQEFEKVVPELSFINPTDGFMGINYAEMTAVLVEAMKEQQAIIDEQKTINEEQNKKIDELEKKIEILFQQVSK